MVRADISSWIKDTVDGVVEEGEITVAVVLVILVALAVTVVVIAFCCLALCCFTTCYCMVHCKRRMSGEQEPEALYYELEETPSFMLDGPAPQVYFEPPPTYPGTSYHPGSGSLI